MSRRLHALLPAELLSAALLGAVLLGAAAPCVTAQTAVNTDITSESIVAVERALDWLARHQNKDGSWTASVGFKLNQDYEITTRDMPHVGVTSLAGMAFLSAGHLPGRGRYGETIRRATDYVLSCVQTGGFITSNETRMYSHAFATLFLAEVYGMTESSAVRTHLQEAVDFIVAAQNAEGAWRYLPHAVESDMSIAVCQLNALRGARDAGIRVPKSTIDRAREYVASSYESRDIAMGYFRDEYYRLGKGSFRYQSRGNSRSSFALTAAGIAALHNSGLYTTRIGGDDHGVVDLDASIDFLMDHYDLVSGGATYAYHYFYWYGHYYATQALYVVGGQAWQWYYPRIRDELIRAQAPDGSLPCRVGPGESFSTAVGAIILSLPYGYLPIFQR